MSSRGGIGLAAVVVVAGMGALGCGGPIDSRPPRPRPDAGVDSGAGGRIVAPLGMGGNSGFDASPDVPWPSVQGCVSGLAPSPQFSADQINPIAVGCASSTTPLLRIGETLGRGLVFRADLISPVRGLSLLYNGNVCVYADSTIQLAVAPSALRPSTPFTTILNITVVGPPPQPTSVFDVTINPTAINFSVDPAVVDFGTVIAGQYLRMPLTVANAPDGSPFDSVFASQPQQVPFLLDSNPAAIGLPSLQPGQARQILQASLNAQSPGTFDATFLVSAFPAGTPVDPACGVVRSVTMHAQVLPAGPP